MAILLMLMFGMIAPLRAEADFKFNPFDARDGEQELDRVLSESELTTALDDNYIELDGTTTTTAQIPFAEGMSVPTSKKMEFAADNTYWLYNSATGRISLFLRGTEIWFFGGGDSFEIIAEASGAYGGNTWIAEACGGACTYGGSTIITEKL